MRPGGIESCRGFVEPRFDEWHGCNHRRGIGWKLDGVAAGKSKCMQRKKQSSARWRGAVQPCACRRSESTGRKRHGENECQRKCPVQRHGERRFQVQFQFDLGKRWNCAVLCAFNGWERDARGLDPTHAHSKRSGLLGAGGDEWFLDSVGRELATRITCFAEGMAKNYGGWRTYSGKRTCAVAAKDARFLPKNMQWYRKGEGEWEGKSGKDPHNKQHEKNGIYNSDARMFPCGEVSQSRNNPDHVRWAAHDTSRSIIFNYEL